MTRKYIIIVFVLGLLLATVDKISIHPTMLKVATFGLLH